MFDDTNIIVGLEIGTSKICAVVGEQNATAAANGRSTPPPELTAPAQPLRAGGA